MAIPPDSPSAAIHAYIQHLIQDAVSSLRSEIKAEVLAELAAEMTGTAVPSPAPSKPTQSADFAPKKTSTKTKVHGHTIRTAQDLIPYIPQGAKNAMTVTQIAWAADLEVEETKTLIRALVQLGRVQGEGTRRGKRYYR